MAQLVLENFRYGLEYRRSELTANPGTLFDALNCFVNEGGEVERRKAWFPMMSATGSLLTAPPTGPNYAWEFEDGGAVLLGNALTIQPSIFLGNSGTGTIPGVIGTAPTTASAAYHIYCLLYDSQTGIFDLTGNALTNVVTVSSKFGYTVHVSVLTNTSAAGTITITDNDTVTVTITTGGTWVAGDHIKIRVAQTNCTLDVGYGIGPMATYPLFSTSSIFGGGTTVPTSFCQLTDPYDANGTITDIVSCTFAGKVFNIAKWSGTGRAYCYYKGTIVPDSLGVGIYDGLISGTSNSQTNINIAGWIATVFNVVGAGVPAGALTASNSGTNVVTFSSLGRNIDITSTHNSVNGVATIGGDGTSSPTLTITGTWAPGEYWSVLTATVAAAGTADASGGSLSGVNPSFCYSFGTKVYLLWNTFTLFSIVGLFSPTTLVVDFHTTASGAGNLDLAKQDNINGNLVTCASYQGKLAFFFRHSIQIWSMVADPTKNERIQTLQNIGAVGRYAVCPIGDLDITFVYDSGVCSLRPRDASSNAIPNDIGASVNLQIRSQLNAKTCIFDRICMGYDPTERKLFVSIPYTDAGYNQAYYNSTQACWTLSYFPASKVEAWTQVDNKWGNIQGSNMVQTQFYPRKYITWHGGLYADSSVLRYNNDGASNGLATGLVVYGTWRVARGTYGLSYDNAQAYFVTPFLSAKSPGVKKHSEGADIIVSGGWTLAGVMSPSAGTFANIVTVGSAGTSDVTNSSTPEGPGIPWDTWGNHVQFKFTGTIDNACGDTGLLTTTPGAQVASQLIWYYDMGGAKE